LPNRTEDGFTEKDWPGTNGTVTPQQGGGDDGAVDEEEHAARENPKANTVKSRIMIRSFLVPKRTIDLAFRPDAEGGNYATISG
jgi:hypothetical protein